MTFKNSFDLVEPIEEDNDRAAHYINFVWCAFLEPDRLSAEDLRGYFDFRGESDLKRHLKGILEKYLESVSIDVGRSEK